MKKTYKVNVTRDGRYTLRRAGTSTKLADLGNEHKGRNRAIASWGVVKGDKLYYVTSTRAAAREFRRTNCPHGRVAVLGYT